MKLIRFLISSTAIVFCSATASRLSAEGSRELNLNSEHRIITNVDRDKHGKPEYLAVYVYAKKGEIINAGSSAYDFIDGGDITVTDPGKRETLLDVLPSGKGLIDTIKKEQSGPFPGNGGYEPLKFTVRNSGIHRIHFNLNNESLSKLKKMKAESDLQTGPISDDGKILGLSAWDVTVTSAGKAKPGRAFLISLSANGRSEEITLQLYVLTKQGLLYSVELPSIQPMGFQFYSVNRGSLGPDGKTLYRTVTIRGNTVLKAGIQKQTPAWNDSPGKQTHWIFINKPSADISSAVPFFLNRSSTSQPFSFTPLSKKENNGGSGGTFEFYSPYDLQYSISIAKNDADANGKKDADIILEGSCVKGINRITWNGKDIRGNFMIPTEKGKGYRAELLFRDIETHFIFDDIENMRKGMKIRLLNPFYIPAGWNPYSIYYNNDRYQINDVIVPLDNRTIDLNEEGKSKYKAQFPEPMNGTSGVDSSNGACAFSGYFGDMKTLDIWTLAPLKTLSAIISPGTPLSLNEQKMSDAEQAKNRNKHISFTIVIPFFSGSSSIDPSNTGLLDTAVAVLGSGKNFSAFLSVPGKGKNANGALTEKRTKAVSKYLENKGISPKQLRFSKEVSAEKTSAENVLIRIECSE